MPEKTALVTGASSGIGRELAKVLAQDGYNLVLVARNEEALRQLSEEFAQQYGVKTTILARDLTRPEAPEEIYNDCWQQGLQIDILVNDAGVGEHGKFATETDLAKELAMIQVNITALVHLTKLFLKDMVARNEGKILMLASVASVLPNPLMAVYGATKSFIYNFTEALRNELSDTNVRVTALMPGATNTDFFHKAGAEGTRAHQQALATDPAKVARDGYEALLKGKDKVVSGLMNKAQVSVAHLLPEPLVTRTVRYQMERPNGQHKTTTQTTTLRSLVGTAVALGLVVWAYNRMR